MISILRLLRPAQWTKNLLVLAPLFFALGDRTQETSLDSLSTAILAALLFCVISSSVYILNDARDADLDRRHPKKKDRPIASGAISKPRALVICLILMILGVAGSIALSTSFATVIIGYLALQVAYTYWLKTIALVDIMVIATGFVLRALAGGAALDIVVSPWLLLCTFLLALFMALCKRRHEKVELESTSSAHRPSLEKYSGRLLDQLIGIVSAATIVSYAIYTLWPDTVAKFGTPALGLTIPFVIFGIFRYLDLVYRHSGGDRPEQILLRDWPTIINLILYAGTVAVIFQTVS